MKILISGTELNVSKCTPYEHANGRRELLITLPQNEVDYATLKGLLDSNDGTIVCTKDDGSTMTYVGYKTSYELTAKTVNEVEIFSIVIVCVAEAERRALEAKQQSEALALVVSQQTETINAQAETIASQALEIEMLNDTMLVMIMG